MPGPNRTGPFADLDDEDMEMIGLVATSVEAPDREPEEEESED